jgi:hypothetical protein
MTNIVHQIFEECKSFTLDPYWKEHFKNFSFNKFPKGVRYDPKQKNLILKIEGKKQEVIALPEDNPSKTFEIVMRIMRENLDFRSTRDLKIQQDEMSEIQKNRVTDMDCEWKKLKPKHLKDQLIMDYIAQLKTKYSLSSDEVKQLISKIQLAFQFKNLSQDDVVYSDGVIKSITGLKFLKSSRKFTVPDSQCTSSKPKPEKVSNKFYVSIDKFMRENSNRLKKFL